MILLLLQTALALDGNDHLSVTLAGPVVVDGQYLRAEPDQVWLSTADGSITALPLVLVEAVVCNGEEMPLVVFQQEVSMAWQQTLSLAEGPTPHPIATAGTSLLLAGAGHALLGEWRVGAGYAVAEMIVLGTAVAMVAVDDPRPLPSLLVLDGFLRVYAAQESARKARQRRAIAEHWAVHEELP